MKRILTLFAAVCAFAAVSAVRGQDGITPNSILIGQSAAFTGPAAQLGIQMRDGAKLWFDYVNAQGGINGRKIELRSRDDKYESKVAAENTKTPLTDSKIADMLGEQGILVARRTIAKYREALQIPPVNMRKAL